MIRINKTGSLSGEFASSSLPGCDEVNNDSQAESKSLQQEDSNSESLCERRDDAGIKSQLGIWMQEHYNLCAVFSHLEQVDKETLTRFQDLLLASVERGKRILDSLSPRKNDTVQIMTKIQEAVDNGLLPVAGSARHKVTVPLSGMRRFDDGRPGVPLKNTIKPGLPAMNANIQSSAGLVNSNNVVGVVPLAPSRTYLKK